MRRTLITALAVVGLLGIAFFYLPARAKPVPWLLNDLDSSDEKTSFAAELELRSRGGSRAVPGLVRKLETLTTYEIQHNWRRGELVRSLTAIGAPAAEPLRRLLESNPPGPVRVGPIEALGKIGDRQSFDLIVRDVDDPDQSVRMTAIEALGLMPGQEAVDVLFTVLETDDRASRFAAARVLSSRRDARFVPRLAQLYDAAPDAIAKKEYATTLAKIGGDEAVRFLCGKLVDESSPFARMELTGMLVSMDNPCVSEALRQSAGHLEVIAAAHSYFLRTPGVVDDEMLVRAFQRYGGSDMAAAFRTSGRPLLVAAVAAEDADPVKRPKTIEVR